MRDFKKHKWICTWFIFNSIIKTKVRGYTKTIMYSYPLSLLWKCIWNTDVKCLKNTIFFILTIDFINLKIILGIWIIT